MSFVQHLQLPQIVFLCRRGLMKQEVNGQYLSIAEDSLLLQTPCLTPLIGVLKLWRLIQGGLNQDLEEQIIPFQISVTTHIIKNSLLHYHQEFPALLSKPDTRKFQESDQGLTGDECRVSMAQSTPRLLNLDGSKVPASPQRGNVQTFHIIWSIQRLSRLN